MWTEEQPYYLKNTELINSRNTFEFLGYLEISGNSIILKDEWEEICCVLPSDKYFRIVLSAKPVFWQTSLTFKYKSSCTCTEVNEGSAAGDAATQALSVLGAYAFGIVVSQVVACFVVARIGF